MTTEPLPPDAVAPLFPFGQPVVWRPDSHIVGESNVAAFAHRVGEVSIRSLFEHARTDPAWFWDAVIRDMGIPFFTPYERVYEDTGDPAFPRWCVGGELNIAFASLDRWQADPETALRPALVFEQEDGTTRTLSYADLHADVQRCASALRGQGLGKGDVVGLYLPMIPELLVAFLAIARIGAVALPLFSGYGPDAIVSRLADADARALVTADGFRRRGKAVDMKRVADAALADVPTCTTVVVVPHAGLDVAMQDGRDLAWDDLLAGEPAFATAERTSAEDVLMLLYTSGTTGKPKGAVHTHCGFPVKAAQDAAHAMDVKPGDVVYWMTDMGWMMGPWLVFATLLNGATMVFYDGAPDAPDAGRLWRIVERHGVTHLGVSPTLVRSLMASGTEPLDGVDLNSLRMVCSTGSPWDPDSWEWCFTHVLGRRRPIVNYSGGTEISGGILCGNVHSPLKACAFSGPVVGMDADVVDSEGVSVRGEVGELVVRGPWIGMTRGFWKDAGGERYRAAYWSQLPGVWVHGDFAAVDEDGLWFILGRSDDTIKVAGKRLGPSEVEAVVNLHPAVRESVAVGVPDALKGEDVVVFAVLHAGETGDEELKSDLLDRVAVALGKPLRPREVRFTAAIPKTRNAKVLRRLIRQAYLGDALGDTSSLDDPTTVDAIRDAT